MANLPDELRLAIAIAVNVFVFVSAYRFVRRITSQDGIGATLDAFLIHYVVQYLSVCIPGLFGLLNAVSMLIVATLLAGAMLWMTSRLAPAATRGVLREEPAWPRGLNGALTRFDLLICSICLFFVLGYFGGLIQIQSSAPLVGDDAMIYHLPAAGQWMQTGRIGLYNTWFANPANTYSPLAGSAFLVWLIAPIGADMIAQFGQMPALILIFFAIIQIARAIGVRVAVASIAATAALLSRPFISEAIIVKDDHFLAAFFLAAIAGCAVDRIRDKLGPWRIGCAIGLFFATKYTALLTAPLLLLVIDAPFRAGWKWRHWGLAVGCAFAIAGPWYLRNWLLTANPLYPVPIGVFGLEIFSGMFVPERSTAMRTIRGAWDALTTGYNSPSRTLAVTLCAFWIGAMILCARQVARDALIRVCLLGPAIGLTIFFLASHAALIRYAFPSLLLLFICTAILAGRSPIPIWGQLPIPAVVAIIAVWGGFENKEYLGRFVVAGLIVAIAGMVILLGIAPLMRRHRILRLAAWSAVGLGLVSVIFIHWRPEVQAARSMAVRGWSIQYLNQARLWQHIGDPQNVPPDAKIAYTNAVFTRPLMGFDYSRTIVYVPTRLGVTNYHDLPASRQRVTDEEIRGFCSDLLIQQADQKQWLQRILAGDAQFLLVGRQPILADPPEKAFADADPTHFRREYADDSGTLYRILR